MVFLMGMRVTDSQIRIKLEVMTLMMNLLQEMGKRNINQRKKNKLKSRNQKIDIKNKKWRKKNQKQISRVKMNNLMY